jgi:putative ABC transport system permease protein
MLNDVRYALRALRRSPGFAISGVLALALGIGANAAVFSVVYNVLLKPLPYSHPERLVRLYERNDGQGIIRGDVSPGTFVDWRARSRTLEAIALFTTGEELWSFSDRSDVINTAAVSPALFSLLRVSPVLGRTFGPEEEERVGVVISYALWQRRFSGAPSVLNDSVSVEGRMPLRVIGVMPRGFAFPEGTEAWTNLPFLSPVGAGERQVRYYHALARLAPDATLAQARAELTTVSAQLEVEQPRSNAGWTSEIEPLQNASTRGLRPALLMLLGAVSGVLLIGCANVANLVLARASGRRHEMAVRMVLGAGTVRILRQCFTESLVLATLGAFAGVLLGAWISAAMFGLAPADVKLEAEHGLNGMGLIAAAAVGLLSASLAGLVAAWQATRENHGGVIGSPRRTVTAHTASLRRWLIIGEVAIVVVLLTSTLLLGRSFIKLRGVDLGFQTDRVLTVETRWPTGRFAVPSRRPWFLLQQAVDGTIGAVRSIPGVRAAGLVTDLPLSGNLSSGSMWRADAPGASGATPPASATDQWKADISIVTPGYFEALGITFVRGRNFSDTDRLTEQQLMNPRAPRTAVAVVNRTFASRYFSNEDPIGKRLVLFDDQTFGGTRTIVGVVSDVRARNVAEAGRPMIFLPHAEHPAVFRPTLVLRSALPPESLATAVRERLHTFDPQLLVLRTRPMNDVVAGALSRPRFNLVLMGSFAVVALSLAAIGIYGVVAFFVTQRTREIGIRVALGARSAAVMRLVLVEGMGPVFVGVAVGVVGSLAATRALRALLFGMKGLDLVSVTGAPAVLVAVAVLACYLPARRALRVDPVVALREE